MESISSKFEYKTEGRSRRRNHFFERGDAGGSGIRTPLLACGFLGLAGFSRPFLGVLSFQRMRPSWSWSWSWSRFFFVCDLRNRVRPHPRPRWGK